jgi:RNA polymerase sigma factor (sigma-70 family)
MTQVQHQRLWTSWQKERSESVFSELVKANIDLVYTTALRSLSSDEHLAKDVTQSGFIDLVHKSLSMPLDVSLSGWLYRQTRYTASKTVRTEQRRRTREKLYHAMESQSQAGGEQTWESIAPHLDHCLQELSDQDRETILLRYFNKRNLKEVGTELGISADAAQKRVSRALEKLKLALGKQGVSLPVAALASAFSMSAVIAAPASLVTQVTSVGVAALGPGTGLGFLLTSLKSNIIATKTQTVLTGTALAVMGAPLVYQQLTINSLRDELSSLSQEMASLESIPAAYQNWKEIQNEIDEFKKLQKDQEELQLLEKKVAELKAEDAEKKTAKLQQLASEKENLANAQKEKDAMILRIEFNKRQFKVINAMKNMGLAARIYSSENQNVLPTTMDQLMRGLPALEEFFEEAPSEGFEFFTHGRTISAMDPTMILFREIEPRFDGETYHRAYTFCDGSVRTVETPDQDFSEFEAKHSIPINQKANPPSKDAQ